jgi:hypothetical protein
LLCQLSYGGVWQRDYTRERKGLARKLMVDDIANLH